MDERSRGEPSSFFTIPESHWRDVSVDTYGSLSRLHAAMGLALAQLEHEHQLKAEIVEGSTISGIPPSPADLALRMHEIAGEILSGVASDEQDLRQIISTLRTAFAVTWDLYSFKEAERLTVAEHMDNLRARIDEFEGELRTVRETRRSALS